jgi:hypothetical protein
MNAAGQALALYRQQKSKVWAFAAPAEFEKPEGRVYTRACVPLGRIKETGA